MRRHWYILAALLAVVLIAGFLIGWVQLSLEADSYGVIFTRARGFDNGVIQPSGFTWRWQRLIPKSLTLYRFALRNEEANFTLRIALPSAEAYASIASEKPDLSIEIRLALVYKIKPEALPRLAKDDGLRPETLANWYQQTRSSLELQATEIILNLIPAGESPRDPTDPSGILTLGRSLTAALPDRFPHLDFVGIAPTVIKAPDMTLYLRLRDTYLRLVAAREESLKAMEPRIAAEEATQRLAVQNHERSIALLARYGELLEKYPALIKFLFLTTSMDLSPRDLQNLDILGKLEALD